MRLSPILILLAATLALVVVGLTGAQFLQPNRLLLDGVSFSLSRITPNADGSEDVTEIRYTVNRTARVNITFTNPATGQSFDFRKEASRPPGEYRVLFSGVVKGYLLPGENYAGEILWRLMPNGEYLWTIEAETESGEKAAQQGTLIIAEGDAVLPAILSFDVVPQVFTPNQDGYDDRISVNLYLAKEARLVVTLEGNGIGPHYLPERIEGRKSDQGDPLAREFDYDGGLDNNMTPPPDGEYRIVAEASDEEGQRVRRTAQVTITQGGKPNAEIVAQSSGRTVTWESLRYTDSYFTNATTPGQKVEPPAGVQSTLARIRLPIGDLLLFRLTIHNYGTVPLRTIGPWPGTVYQYDQTNAAMTAPESREAISGAWRVGVECERTESSYPWRWAIGSPDALMKVKRENETLWYLMPGQRATVWGAVRMTKLIPTRNPQKCYAALIHEDVAIPPRQNRVGEIDVELMRVQ